MWAASLPLFVSAPAEADYQYQFDDLYGPSGKGEQWMVVTTDGSTAGAPTARTENTIPFAAPMDTEADLPSGRGPAYLTNGGVSREPIDTLFLVLSGKPDSATTGGTLWVSFDSAAAGPNTQDVTVDSDSYNVVKTPFGMNGTDQLYRLDFTKRRGTSAYESVRGNFIFHQNPNDAPSQTLEIPFVVANVYGGTAEWEPLRFRSDIRDAGTSSSGNIVAHDRFTWDVTADKNVGVNTDWVFVPLPKLPQDSNRVNYRITTEVANYTGIRYGLQRYDGYASYYWIYPAYWAFDIPSTGTATGDVLRKFYLRESSHIPPGLVTAYSQNFDVVSGVKEVMHLYPIDPGRGFRTLTVEHRSIFGLDLGTFRDTSVSPASYVVTGFNFLSAGVDFLDKAGRAFGVSGVRMPEQTDGVMAGAVEYEYIGGDVIASVGVSAGVPARIRSGGRGLLPLHVTFNLRRSNQLVNPHWDTLRDQWRQTGGIENIFTDYFSLYLQDSRGNNLDLIKDSLKDAYGETVKVFLDEQNEVITVHFIALLMDGPRSSVQLVKDETTTTSNTHIVVMDGNDNGKWEMKFFAAPAGYIETDGGTGGGGGGCGVGLSIPAIAACVFAILKWRQKR
ncbi:MAG: hypothetical protein LBO82_08430 [Synergistaceae bacterium]|nr:hypothetical protein [Synergistaceae bacterium]